jgi:hypothetical protein
MHPALRGSLWAAMGAIVAVATIAAFRLAWNQPTGAPPAPGATAASPPAISPGAAPPAGGVPEPHAAEPEVARSPGLESLGGTWENVDMEAVRRAMPDNLYWTMAVPTDDPRIQEQRDAERKRWNDEWGKVLSGTATEEEIDAYFTHRNRLSRDYVEFTKYVLDHYRDDLSPQDVALLELAQRLHLARLAELPRKLVEAHERKREQDAARAAWLADEAEFADPQEGD